MTFIYKQRTLPILKMTAANENETVYMYSNSDTGIY